MAQTDKSTAFFFQVPLSNLIPELKESKEDFQIYSEISQNIPTSTFGVSHYTIINQGLERQERDKINLQKWLPANINLEQVSIQMYFLLQRTE